MLRPTLTAVTCLLAFAAGSALAAPKPTAPAPGPQGLGGPPIKGLCMISQPTLLNTAKVSAVANKRLQELEAAAQAEINGQRAPLDADLKQLQADAVKTPQSPDIEKRRQALQTRFQQVQVTTDQRNREIQATRAKVAQRISTEVQPVVAVVYKARGCSILLAREAVLGGNTDGDLTIEVIKGLDAKITTISFDRENLPAK